MRRTGDEECRIVKAEEILEMIVRGKDVVVEGGIIRGDLDLSKMDLETVPTTSPKSGPEFESIPRTYKKFIESKIKITNSVERLDTSGWLWVLHLLLLCCPCRR